MLSPSLSFSLFLSLSLSLSLSRSDDFVGEMGKKRDVLQADSSGTVVDLREKAIEDPREGVDIISRTFLINCGNEVPPSVFFVIYIFIYPKR